MVFSIICDLNHKNVIQIRVRIGTMMCIAWENIGKVYKLSLLKQDWLQKYLYTWQSNHTTVFIWL